MIRTISVLTALAVIALAFGCSSPRQSSLLDTTYLEKVQKKLEDEFLKSCVIDAYWENPTEAERNRIVTGLLACVDYDYQQYEFTLSMGRRTTDLAFDVGLLGINAATAITGGESAKTILAVIATALTGTRISIDKNLFFEKSTPALLSTMRAERADRRTHILERLEAPLDMYLLETALSDIFDYYKAGTLTNAMIVLSEESASKARTAQTRAATAQTDRLQRAAQNRSEGAPQ